MKWSQIILSAIGTLAVTIIAGWIVYLTTRENARSVPKPRLVYEVNEPVTFINDQIKTVFHDIRISNTGDQEAEDVDILATWPREAAVRGFRIDAPPSMSIDTTQNTRGTLGLHVALLNPKESIRLTVFLEQTSSRNIQVSIRGKGVTGEQGQIATSPALSTAQEKTSQVEFLSFVLPLLVMFQMMLLLMLLLFRRYQGHSPVGINNLGFRFAHKRMVPEALQCLKRAYETGADAYNLSNYGFALALEGKYEDAKNFCALAQDYARNSHQKMVVSYNLACVLLVAGDKQSSIPHLENALSLDYKTCAKYLRMNENLKDYQTDADIKDLLQKKASK